MALRLAYFSRRFSRRFDTTTITNNNTRQHVIAASSCCKTLTLCNSSSSNVTTSSRNNYLFPGSSSSSNVRMIHSSLIIPKKETSNASKDVRLAGRLRFYKNVDVTTVSPPWEGIEQQQQQNSNNNNNDNVVVEQQQQQQESPISAGVDGSQSASGVHHPLQQDEINVIDLEYMLTPRRPGISISSEDQKDTNKNTNTKWYGVTLDGKTLKTPMGQTLALPSKHLAYAIAVEWDAQTKYLQPSQMPLMTMACTALDQVAMHPHGYREQSLNYLPTDTTCFWADPMEDRVLHRRQELAWSELHNYIEKRFHHPPAFAIGANEGMIMTRKRPPHKPYSGLPHPPTLYDEAMKWTNTLDAWHLVALHAICSQAKSFLVALAVLESYDYNNNNDNDNDGSSSSPSSSPFKADMSKAIEASRVEEEFQISNWGLVEGGHDYDRLNCSIQLYAAQNLTRMIAMNNDL